MNIELFNFESKDVRIINDSETGEVHFVGKDVATVLGYVNTNDAINRHCKGVAKYYPISDSLGRTQEARIITEGDLFRLITSSQLESAQEFELKVFDEILPSIRRTGSYSVNQKTYPDINDPAIAAIMKTLVELNSVKVQQVALTQQTALVEKKADILENRIQNVELQHRNGVPTGYLSRKQAHGLYGVGLSAEIFHMALAASDVPTKPYIHRCDEGHDVATTAYYRDDIETAIEIFLDDAWQATEQMCASPMLNNKRFMYMKSKAA